MPNYLCKAYKVYYMFSEPVLDHDKCNIRNIPPKFLKKNYIQISPKKF